MRIKRRFFLAVALLLTMSVQGQETKNHNLEVAKNLDISTSCIRTWT